MKGRTRDTLGRELPAEGVAVLAIFEPAIAEKYGKPTPARLWLDAGTWSDDILVSGRVDRILGTAGGIMIESILAAIAGNACLLALVILVTAQLIGTAMNLPFRFWNRFLRSRNIDARGWPPPHLDADGDWKPEPTDES